MRRSVGSDSRPPRPGFRLALCLAVLPMGAALAGGGEPSTKDILKGVLKEFAKQRAEALVTRALGPRFGNLVSAAYEVKKSGGKLGDAVKQSFIEALLGNPTPGLGGSTSNPKMVAAFQNVLGRAPGPDGTVRPRRGLLNNPQVQMLAGLVLAHKTASGPDRGAARRQILDTLLPLIEGELARKHTRFAEGAAQVLGVVRQVRDAKQAARVAAASGGVVESGEPVPEPGYEPPPDPGYDPGGTGTYPPVEVADPDSGSEGATEPVPEDPYAAAGEGGDEAPGAPPEEPGPVDDSWVATPEDQRLMDEAVRRAVSEAGRSPGGAPDEEAIRRIVAQVVREQRKGSP